MVRISLDILYEPTNLPKELRILSHHGGRAQVLMQVLVVCTSVITCAHAGLGGVYERDHMCTGLSGVSGLHERADGAVLLQVPQVQDLRRQHS